MDEKIVNGERVNPNPESQPIEVGQPQTQINMDDTFALLKEKDFLIMTLFSKIRGLESAHDNNKLKQIANELQNQNNALQEKIKELTAKTSC